MHRHKFRLVPATQIMNGVRSEFFTRAALAFDEHIGGGGRDLPDRIEHFM